MKLDKKVATGDFEFEIILLEKDSNDCFQIKDKEVLTYEYFKNGRFDIFNKVINNLIQRNGGITTDQIIRFSPKIYA